jgi:hypothetical protein
MLFLVREKVDLGGIVLEDVSYDAVTDTSGATSYYIYLWQSAIDSKVEPVFQCSPFRSSREYPCRG